MKKILFGAFVLLLTGCSHKDDPEPRLPNLYQTQWRGTYQFFDGEVKKCPIMITFTNENGGWYEGDDAILGLMYFANFKYEAKDKIVHVTGVGSSAAIQGYWWIARGNRDELVLKRDPDMKYESKLTLKKIRL